MQFIISLVTTYQGATAIFNDIIGIKSILISPKSHWEEYICPDCNELMEDPVLTLCGHRLCWECFDKRRSSW